MRTKLVCRFGMSLGLAVLIWLSAVMLPGWVVLAAKGQPVKVETLYLTRDYKEPIPLSLVDKIVTDNGRQGARYATKENNKTGRFLGYEFDLKELVVPLKEDFSEKISAALGTGERLVIADLEADDLATLASLPATKNSIIFNVRINDNGLRQEQCNARVFHIPPSWAARADALAQYLIWKKWRRWVLIKGTRPGDAEFAQSVKRAAVRFGGKIVAEKTYKFEAGARRVETGHQQVQTQIPMVTQDFPEHDVVVVADTGEQFGEYLPYRIYRPRPVVGTQGLMPLSWHRSFEQWGSKSMQRKFDKFAGRPMRERDYSAWAAARSIGEAVVRDQTGDVGKIYDYLRSEKFVLGGFKGVGLNFRLWNNQMRQPILISSAKSLVSLSPQDGFLHQKSLSDTLGFDEPETKCEF